MKKDVIARLYKKKVILGVAFWLVVAVGVKAQTGNNWCFGSAGYGWDFRTDPPTFFKTAMHASGGTQAVSDNLGNLLFYTDGDTIWSKNHLKMKGSFGSVDVRFISYTPTINPSAVLPVPGKPGRYYVFLGGYPDPTYIPKAVTVVSLGYREVDLNKNGGLGEVLDSSRRLLTNYNTYELATVRHSNKKDFWLLARARDTILVYSITNSGINLAFKTFFDDPSKNVGQYSSSGVSGGIKVANNGQSLVLFLSFMDTVFLQKKHHRSFLYKFPFNPATGVLQAPSLIDSTCYEWGLPGAQTFKGAVFAPGDSVLYALTTTGSGSGNSGAYNSIIQYQLDSNGVFKQTYRWYSDNSAYTCLQLAPNGKVYIGAHLNGPFNMGSIEKPEVVGEGCKITKDKIVMPYLLFPYPNGYRDTTYTRMNSLPASYNDFMRVKFLCLPNKYCDGVTHFYNRSDTGCFNRYRWYINGDSIDAVNTQYTFTKAGLYFVKLRATTPAGYHVWYSDSIEIKPEHFPPRAGFLAQTQTGCQWVSFILNDTSKSLTNKAGAAFKQWDFGDGQMMNDTLLASAVALHKYTKSGEYTIKLTYFNGYCTDTFLLQQQVTILAAPKPGFYFSPASGCSPLKTILQPKTEGEVDSFYYSFDNGVSWLFTQNGILEKEFTEGGVSFVLQKLKGPTGCVTNDTQKLIISHGLPANYRQEIYSATYNERNAIELKWLPVNNAHKYKVFYGRDGVSFTDKFITTDTVVIDSAISAKYENYYRMVAVDSCGNNSTEGNLAKPVLMIAEAEGNEKTVIRFSTYEQAGRKIKSYSIQRKNAGDEFQNICVWNPSVSYNDNDFFKLGGKGSCYRIKVDFEVPQEGFSLSNEICLDYRPVLWIPDAFSPNEDGVNDDFFIVYAGIEKFELTIYNSWGEKIFYTTDPAFRWKGEKIPSGVYSYVLSAKCTNQRINTSGTITLMR